MTRAKAPASLWTGSTSHGFSAYVVYFTSQRTWVPNPFAPDICASARRNVVQVYCASNGAHYGRGWYRPAGGQKEGQWSSTEDVLLEIVRIFPFNLLHVTPNVRHQETDNAAIDGPAIAIWNVVSMLLRPRLRGLDPSQRVSKRRSRNPRRNLRKSSKPLPPPPRSSSPPVTSSSLPPLPKSLPSNTLFLSPRSRAPAQTEGLSVRMFTPTFR